MGEGAGKLLEGLLRKIKSDRRAALYVYGGLALLCLLLCLPQPEKKRESPQEVTGKQGAGELEERLMETLSCVRGAGRVKVMITYDTGPEIVPAMSRDVTSEGVSESRREASEPVTVYRDGEDRAIVLMEREPKVRGVIVVAQGAADISVRLKLQAAVQAVLGVEAARVEVLEMGMKGAED